MIKQTFVADSELLDVFAQYAKNLEGESGLGILEEISDSVSIEASKFMSDFLDQWEGKVEFFFEWVEVNGNRIEWGINAGYVEIELAEPFDTWLKLLGAKQVETQHDFDV